MLSNGVVNIEESKVNQKQNSRMAKEEHEGLFSTRPRSSIRNIHCSSTSRAEISRVFGRESAGDVLQTFYAHRPPPIKPMGVLRAPLLCLELCEPNS
ncbi:hypothetical protein EVAR_91593_1 [Eumeta japonica]|uniref:Uncharacterized protein n=1 Tax=Eumeta variegata TaxID=151549 RepID=A0A4C1UY24_EUMVA|nr:hypothetical protein EVAR_91593_1 [Eumeta japonica]